MSRVVVWFSCGAASAVAAKMAVQEYGDRCVIAYCDTGGEHESNKQFLLDVQEWVGAPVEILKNTCGYTDHFDVYRKTKYLVGVRGARCTIELKKRLRFDFQRPDDIHVFGYTSDEKERADFFNRNNPELATDWILVRNNVSKEDCLGLLWQERIKIPKLYELGYGHNNCIGCVKGGKGYWNQIRKDFPEVYQEMALVEREINHSIFRKEDGTRIWLDEMPKDAGNYKKEPPISCGLSCGDTLDQIRSPNAAG